MANGSFVETYEDPKTIYKVMLTVYSENMESVIISNTYNIDTSKSTLVDTIKPSNTSSLFQLSPRFVLTDLTSYVGKKDVLQLNILFSKGGIPIPIHFSKSQRFSNRRAEFSIPLMSDYLEIHVV